MAANMFVKTERQMRGDYPVIASGIDPTQVTVNERAVEGLYTFLRQQFLPAMAQVLPSKRGLADIDSAPGVVAVGQGLGRHPYYAPDLAKATYTGMLLSHQAEDSWRLRAMDNRYIYGGSRNKIMTHYFIDVAGNEVVKAKRDVYFMFQEAPQTPEAHSRGVISIDAGQTTYDLFDRIYDAYANEDEEGVARVMYQRPLSEVDCDRLKTRLIRIANRAGAMTASQQHADLAS